MGVGAALSRSEKSRKGEGVHAVANAVPSEADQLVARGAYHSLLAAARPEGPWAQRGR